MRGVHCLQGISSRRQRKKLPFPTERQPKRLCAKISQTRENGQPIQHLLPVARRSIGDDHTGRSSGSGSSLASSSRFYQCHFVVCSPIQRRDRAAITPVSPIKPRGAPVCIIQLWRRYSIDALFQTQNPFRRIERDQYWQFGKVERKSGFRTSMQKSPTHPSWIKR